MAQKTAPLSPLFTPQKVHMLLPTSEVLLDDLENELHEAAYEAEHAALLRDNELLEQASGFCRRFMEDVSTLEWANKVLQCQFIRLSATNRPASAYHLDVSPKNQQANLVAVNKRLIWKLLINMSSTKRAQLHFLNVDPFTMDLQVSDRSLFCETEQLPSFMHHKASIPQRDGIAVHGLLFCASRVLHSDGPNADNQFIAGFGCEEKLAI